MILNKSWLASLSAKLAYLSKPGNPQRLAVVGIGNELGGDDAAGVQVARLLKPRMVGNQQILVLEAGLAPENFTGLLRRFSPQLILLVDAALMGCLPGTIQVIDWASAEGFSASTHTLPLNILASYLTAELGCELVLIGIQPGQTYMDAPLTSRVQEAVKELTSALVKSINQVIHPGEVTLPGEKTYSNSFEKGLKNG